jgi:hypothetical protein
MLAIHDHKVAFLHVPKTGGCSIFEALHQRVGGSSLWETMPGAKGPTPHVRVDFMMKKYDWMSEYWRFAFVRHPFDRLVSLYHFWRNRMEPRYTPEGFVMQPMSLHGLPIKIRDAINYTTFESWAFDNIESVNTQMHFISKDDEVVMDFVGRFENIQEDFAKVAERLNTSPELPFRNKGEHKPYEEYYTNPALRSFVTDYFWCDFKAFGYEPPPRPSLVVPVG